MALEEIPHIGLHLHHMVTSKLMALFIHGIEQQFLRSIFRGKPGQGVTLLLTDHLRLDDLTGIGGPQSHRFVGNDRLW